MQIWYPLELVPNGLARWLLFAVLLGLTFWMMQLIKASGDLTTDAAPSGIVSLQLAGTVEKVRQIFASWNANQIDAAFKNLRLDNIFLFVYSTTLALACVMAAGVWEYQGIIDRNFGLVLAWSQWLAALFDLTENFALETMLKGTVANPWPQIAAACAIPKFILILAGFSYGVLGVLMWLISLWRPN